MADLVVVVPSRGRPAAARELADAFQATCTAATELVFAVDEDDPTLGEYSGIPRDLANASTERSAQVSVGVVPESKSMVYALNVIASYVTIPPNANGGPFAVGFMGDDHRPRTNGWDTAYLETLRELGTGIVYGNDLLQCRNLPTQCAMTADIVKTVGYMAPPSLTHLYVDNYWLALGTQADCIRYLPDVIVEHRHPVAGKNQWDEGYERVNHPGMFAKDETAFRDYYTTTFPADVEKVRELRRVNA